MQTVQRWYENAGLLNIENDNTNKAEIVENDNENKDAIIANDNETRILN